MTTLTVLGLDLSLTSTGVSTAWGALLASAPVFEAVKPPPKLKTWARMDWMIKELGGIVTAADPDLIVIEGPGYHAAARGSYWHENAGLWWEITLRLWRARRPMTAITPSTLKKYATGSGAAKKSAMCVAAAHRFGLAAIGEDEADALWLAAAGCQHYGWPLVKLPAVQVAALDVVAWPTLHLEDSDAAAVPL
jgi:crossover junction endodeoxyribonuclease RuvC